MFLETSIILQSQKLKLTDLTSVLTQTREDLVLARHWLPLASTQQPQQVWMAPPWHKSCCASTVSTPTRLAGVQMLEAWQTILLIINQLKSSPVLHLQLLLGKQAGWKPWDLPQSHLQTAMSHTRALLLPSIALTCSHKPTELKQKFVSTKLTQVSTLV